MMLPFAFFHPDSRFAMLWPTVPSYSRRDGLVWRPGMVPCNRWNYMFCRLQVPAICSLSFNKSKCTQIVVLVEFTLSLFPKIQEWMRRLSAAQCGVRIGSWAHLSLGPERSVNFKLHEIVVCKDSTCTIPLQTSRHDLWMTWSKYPGNIRYILSSFFCLCLTIYMGQVWKIFFWTWKTCKWSSPPFLKWQNTCTQHREGNGKARRKGCKRKTKQTWNQIQGKL